MSELPRPPHGYVAACDTKELDKRPNWDDHFRQWDPVVAGPDWCCDISLYDAAKLSLDNDMSQDGSSENTQNRYSETYASRILNIVNKRMERAAIKREAEEILSRAQNLDVSIEDLFSKRDIIGSQLSSMERSAHTISSRVCSDLTLTDPAAHVTSTELTTSSDRLKVIAPIKFFASSNGNGATSSQDPDTPFAGWNKESVISQYSTNCLSVPSNRHCSQRTAASQAQEEPRLPHSFSLVEPIADRSIPATGTPSAQYFRSGTAVMPPTIFERSGPAYGNLRKTVTQSMMPQSAPGNQLPHLAYSDTSSQSGFHAFSNALMPSYDNMSCRSARLPPCVGNMRPVRDATITTEAVSKSYDDNIHSSSTLILGVPRRIADSQAHRQTASINKRLRTIAGLPDEISDEGSTKLQRSQKDMRTAPEISVQASGLKACGIISLQDEALPFPAAFGQAATGSELRPSSIPNTGSVTVSQANLARSLIAPGQVLADPNDPIVAEYIHAFTQSQLQQHRQDLIAANARSKSWHRGTSSDIARRSSNPAKPSPMVRSEPATTMEPLYAKAASSFDPSAEAVSFNFNPMSSNETIELLQGTSKRFLEGLSKTQN